MIIDFDDATVEKYKNECKIRPVGCFSPSCSISFPNHPSCNPFETLDFIENDYLTNIILLLMMGVVYRLIAVAIFYFVIYDKDKISKPVPDNSMIQNLRNRNVNQILEENKITVRPLSIHKTLQVRRIKMSRKVPRKNEKVKMEIGEDLHFNLKNQIL